METTNLLQAAIQARIKGYNVIPLRGGEPGNENYKRPSVAWEKYQKELSTITEIRGWYEANPSMVFGIVTGAVSKLFVVDLDSEESAAAFFQLNGDSACIKIKTRKGWHVYYRWSEELASKSTTRVRLKDKLDVRGEGGYVVAWDLENLPDLSKLPPVPKWILDLLPNRANTGAPTSKPLGLNRDWLADALASLKEGNRNDTFTRIAGSLRNRGYNSETIFQLLRSKAQEVGFPLFELQTICNSVGRYEPAKPESDGENGNTLKFSELLAMSGNVEWISDDILAKESIAFIVGIPGTGKTWLGMDLAIECAREHGLWLGRFPVKRCKVLYIDQERPLKETKRRLAALAAAKDLPRHALDTHLETKIGTTIRIDLDRSFEKFRQELAEKRPELIIVDSFKTFHTKDINSNFDMQAIGERLKGLRSEFGCTFVFIYHENKGAYDRTDAKGKKKEVTAEYMAGAAALSEFPETIYIVDGRGNKENMVYQVKNNPGDLIAPFQTKIINVTPDKSKIEVKVI